MCNPLQYKSTFFNNFCLTFFFTLLFSTYFSYTTFLYLVNSHVIKVCFTPWSHCFVSFVFSVCNHLKKAETHLQDFFSRASVWSSTFCCDVVKRSDHGITASSYFIVLISASSLQKVIVVFPDKNRFDSRLVGVCFLFLLIEAVLLSYG